MPEITYIDIWMALCGAGLAYALWRLWRLTRDLREKTEGMAKALTFKQDKRPPRQPRLRAHRVDTVFHDRDDQGREHWLCVNCGANVPKMGHTVAACEEHQAEQAKADAEAAGVEALDAAFKTATAGVEENKVINLKDKP